MRLSFCHGLPTLQTQNLIDQMKGINEHQWEEDEHNKDFITRVNDGSCGKIFQCLNLKYCILGETS